MCISGDWIQASKVKPSKTFVYVYVGRNGVFSVYLSDMKFISVQVQHQSEAFLHVIASVQLSCNTTQNIWQHGQDFLKR